MKLPKKGVVGQFAELMGGGGLGVSVFEGGGGEGGDTPIHTMIWENKLSLKEILGHSVIFWIVGELHCLVLSVESIYVLATLSALLG